MLCASLYIRVGVGKSSDAREDPPIYSCKPASLDHISSESEVCIHVISEDFQLQKNGGEPIRRCEEIRKVCMQDDDTS